MTRGNFANWVKAFAKNWLPASHKNRKEGCFLLGDTFQRVSSQYLRKTELDWKVGKRTFSYEKAYIRIKCSKRKERQSFPFNRENCLFKKAFTLKITVAYVMLLQEQKSLLIKTLREMK